LIPAQPAANRPLADPPRLLCARKEVAYQLSLSIRAVDYLIAARHLNTRKIGGRILVSHDELIRFARADRMEPAGGVGIGSRGI
jgi:hypothetical protein